MWPVTSEVSFIQTNQNNIVDSGHQKCVESEDKI